MPGKRILLVDYDPRSLTHTREVLEGAGFDVSTCGDGLTAIDQFKALTPDLVLLSAMLPKMHGFEVCSNIRKLPGGNKTPVVIITDVYKGKRYRVDAINKYGATEYIEKPIEDSNLVTILRGFVKENGQSDIPFDDGESTVQFNRDMLDKMVRQDVTGASRTASEKKTVNDKPKKDEVSKKLEESLAGLDLGVGKKSKPTANQAAKTEILQVPLQQTAEQKKGPESSGPVFTSEDLFTDVIASVERELQSEKMTAGEESLSAPTEILSVPPGVTAPSAPTVAMPAPQPRTSESASAPTIQMKQPPKPAEPKKASAFDSDLEKKLSDTLSGLKKPVAVSAKPSATAKPAEPTKVLPGDAKPPVAEPTRRIEMPRAEPAQPVAPVQDALPAAVAAKIVQEEGINFGQYLLLEKIATGGMAELFLAKRKGVEGFEKILAIKRILPHMSDNEEFVTMFIDEAKLAAQLTHHNICQIFDLGKIENAYYIAMEYVHGKDLRAILRSSRTKAKAIPVDLAVLVVSKIASALDYAHRKRGSNGQHLNLVHRDVSPQNILISYEGEVKLADFGIAKAATKAHVTQHGALKGKLLYMSPEQAWGKQVDKRSDIFSLGVVLYELLTGRPLFFDENDTEVSILEKVREARVTPIREFNSRVPAELEKIVGRALKKNQDDRYQSAYEMQKDLDNLFYAESYTATGATLANYMRDLFPDESHEGERKEPAVEKEPAKPIGASVAADIPAPVIKPEPKKPEPEVVKPAVAPVQKPVEKKATVAPLAETSAPAQQSGFRDISVPDMMAPSEPRRFPIVPLGIAAFVIVGLIAYFLFRTSPETPAEPKQTASVKQQPKDVAPVSASTATPAPAANTPAPAVEEKKPKADEKTAEDEKKLLAEQKAESEKKKKEEEAARKKEEERLKEEQRLAQQQKDEEDRLAQEQAEAARLAQAQQAAPVQETPKLEPEPVKEAPKKEEPAPAVATPQKPTVNEGDLVDLGSDVVKPEVVNRTKPNYPPAAFSRKVEGTVLLSVLVTESGKVGDVKVLRPAGGTTGLNEAAIAAVKQWTFKPAVKAGKKVKVWVTYPIVFKIQG